MLGGGDFSGSLLLKSTLLLTSENGSIDPYIAKYHPGSGGQLLGTPVWGTSAKGSLGSDELTAIATLQGQPDMPDAIDIGPSFVKQAMDAGQIARLRDKGAIG